MNVTLTDTPVLETARLTLRAPAARDWQILPSGRLTAVSR